VSLARNSLTLDALVFIMLRCLRAFAPYSDENTVLGEVLSEVGNLSSAELWKQSVMWGVREKGYEIRWPEGRGWLEGSVRAAAQALLDERYPTQSNLSL
jgi:hypothetical protein